MLMDAGRIAAQANGWQNAVVDQRTLIMSAISSVGGPPPPPPPSQARPPQQQAKVDADHDGDAPAAKPTAEDKASSSGHAVNIET